MLMLMLDAKIKNLDDRQHSGGQDILQMFFFTVYIIWDTAWAIAINKSLCLNFTDSLFSD